MSMAVPCVCRIKKKKAAVIAADLGLSCSECTGTVIGTALELSYHHIAAAVAAAAAAAVAAPAAAEPASPAGRHFPRPMRLKNSALVLESD